VLPGADERTKRYTAFLKLEIDEVLLVPGLTGEASIIVGSEPNALLADKRAMVGHNVFVVKDGRAFLRPVIVGNSSLRTTQIVSGVDEGDLVILTDAVSFREGQHVRAVQEKKR
jgi:multidrug efflux pump subunit AcrA (membrane-fusion protein)